MQLLHSKHMPQLMQRSASARASASGQSLKARFEVSQDVAGVDGFLAAGVAGRAREMPQEQLIGGHDLGSRAILEIVHRIGGAIRARALSVIVLRRLPALLPSASQAG